MTTKAELGTLEASGLITVASVKPELEYLFRHALVQDAAYSSLLKQDRRSLHKLAAQTLLELYPERRRELAGVIAMHFEQAGDMGAATEHLIVAGEHALERFAQREAVSFFARANELLPADEGAANLRMRTAIGTARAGWTFTGLSGALEQLEHNPELLGIGARRVWDGARALELGALVDQQRGVTTVVEDHVRPVVPPRPAEHLLGAPPVLLECLALPGEHGDPLRVVGRALRPHRDGGGGVILGGEDVAGRPADGCPERVQRLDQHGGLDGHVQAAGDAGAPQRLGYPEFFANCHEAGHFVLGHADFLAPPFGQ